MWVKLETDNLYYSQMGVDVTFDNDNSIILHQLGEMVALDKNQIKKLYDLIKERYGFE